MIFPADGTHMFNIYVTGASSTVTNLVTGRKGLFTSPIDGNWFTVYNRNTGWTGTVIIKMQKLVIAVADDFRNRLDFKYLAAGPSKMINNSSTLSDATNGTNSLNDLQVNRIYTIGAYPIGVLDAPKENATGTIVSFYYHPDTTYNGRPSNNDGLAQIFIGSNFIASRWRVTGSWTNWLIYDKSNALSIHPHSNSILSSSDLSKVTDETNNADLFPINKIIFIESESLSIENAASIDSLGHAKSGIYITIKGTPSEIQNVSGCTQIFIGADEIAYRFKAGSTWGAWIFSEKAATEYYVGPTRNHTSLTSLLLDLSGDQSKKIIHIDDGEYDIFSEYVSEIQDSRHRITIPPDDITAADYFGTYNAFVPNNTKIIGHGNVILKFTPTVAQLESLSDDANHTGYGASRTWSPLNIYGSVEIENLTVVCHNCRYCLHNDDHNHYQKSYQYYKNIRFLYTYSDLNTANLRLGFNNTIGFGIQEGSTHVFEDCEIYMDTTTNSGVYYGHESANAKNGRLILKNCRIHSSNFSNTSVIRLQSLATSSGNVEALFENCYINGGLRLEMYYTTSPQNFSVTFVNCNKVPVTRRIASGGIIVDDKTVTWYNPLPTPTVDNPLIETDQYSS